MATGFIVNGKRELADGLTVVNWLDNPRIRLGPGDWRKRFPAEWIHMVVLHTTRGIPGGDDQRPQVIRPGLGPNSDADDRLARWWSREQRGAGAHLVVDFDGQISCLADLATEATYHAGHANGASVGVEVVQGGDAELYEGQLETVVRLCDWLTRRFGVQRMIPHRYLGPVQRLTSDVDDVVGVVGHRDLTARRGAGDPGSRIMNDLGRAGYEPVDYQLGEDRDVWRRRQRDLGIDPADGIAGPKTCKTLKAAGYAHGLWVRRPGDDQ